MRRAPRVTETGLGDNTLVESKTHNTTHAITNSEPQNTQTHHYIPPPLLHVSSKTFITGRHTTCFSFVLVRLLHHPVLLAPVHDDSSLPNVLFGP